tara:strand:+ start:651 stop:794 length:144 start_codon:yes stop_codon:yes gene_type:complete
VAQEMMMVGLLNLGQMTQVEEAVLVPTQTIQLVVYMKLLAVMVVLAS